MNLRAVRSTLVSVILLAIGCSGGTGLGSSCAGGCGGCSGSTGCLAPIPGGFPPAQQINNAIAAQLTPQAMTFFEANLQSLVSSLLGSNGIQIGCMSDIYSDSINLDITTVTVSASVCCAGGANQCGVDFSFGNLTIEPETASNGSVNVNVTLPLQIDTQTIPVTGSVSTFLGDFSATCDISYDQSSPVPVTATLNLAVDPTYGNILAANVTNLSLTSLINTSDLSISGGNGSCGITNIGGCLENGLCDIAGDLISNGTIGGALVSALTPTLNSEVQGELDKIRCQACDTAQWTANGGCPTPSSGPAATCDASTQLCYINKDLTTPTSDTCAPALLGLQGRVDVGADLASFGGPPDATMDIYAAAGGSAPSGHAQSTYIDSAATTPPYPGGLVIGVMGGTNSPDPSQCVPIHAPPVLTTPTPISFETAANETGVPAIPSYDAAFSISGEYLNKALYDAYTAGVICLNIDSSVSSLISTGTFSTFLPSLGYLGHGEARPMLVALRPKNPPTVTIGLGTTTTSMSGVVTIDQPLLTIGMQDLQIDFYAFLEERYVRVFSLSVPNFQLPLALDFDGGAITPVLGSLSTALTGLTEANCQMMDGTDCQFFNSSGGMNMGLGAILGLLPIGSLIPSISLPSFEGISVDIDSARGAIPDASEAGTYQQMVLFASLSTAPPAMHRPRTNAVVSESHVPPLAQVLANNDRPYVVVQASADGAGGDYEYAYRIDGNLWSLWSPTDRLEIHSPVFFLEGKHTIDVMSRIAGQPGTEDPTPASVQFVVDYTPPRVQLSVDRGSGQLLTSATDNVWGSDLTYQYSIDGGSWSSPSKVPQSFSLKDDLASSRSVDVQVTDGSGHTAVATWGDSPRLTEAAAEAVRNQAAP